MPLDEERAVVRTGRMLGSATELHAQRFENPCEECTHVECTHARALAALAASIKRLGHEQDEKL